MEFSELKTRFLKYLVVNGIDNRLNSLVDIPIELKEGVPARLLTKWMNQFYKAEVLTELPIYPRLINGFTLGADPELSFYNNQLVAANTLGLQTGMAFGMDMNGRLVELRPAPSRFMLNIVASILAELRWMAIRHPVTTAYQWLAASFDGQDGVGGHVHLARKRSEQDMNREVKSFSALYDIFIQTGVFDRISNANRVNKTKYGRAHDYRFQKHGYEFRGFPTWLDSPWLAYFVLTLSKLVLIDPDLIDFISKNKAKGSRYLTGGLFNLVNYYKNTDDDAWIAHQALSRRGLPKQSCLDFKSNWGITYSNEVTQGALKPTFYPSIIEGTEGERQAIFRYLIYEEPIKPLLPRCNWQPSDIVKGYNWLMSYSKTYHKIGIGEIINDLVSSSKLQVNVLCSDDERFIQINSDLPVYYNCVKEFKKLNKDMWVNFSQGTANTLDIKLPSSLRTNEMIPSIKRILTSGIFPLWNVKDVKEDSYSNWVKEHKMQFKPVGKELVL